MKAHIEDIAGRAPPTAKQRMACGIYEMSVLRVSRGRVGRPKKWEETKIFEAADGMSFSAKERDQIRGYFMDLGINQALLRKLEVCLNGGGRESSGLASWKLDHQGRTASMVMQDKGAEHLLLALPPAILDGLPTCKVEKKPVEALPGADATKVIVKGRVEVDLSKVVIAEKPVEEAKLDPRECALRDLAYLGNSRKTIARLTEAQRAGVTLGDLVGYLTMPIPHNP